MNTDNGALSFDAYINNTDFKRQIDEMNARIKGLSSSTVKETKKMDDAFGGLGKTVMALGSTALLAGFARQIVTVTGEFQKLDIAFTTMLGSKERANALMAQIVDTAAKTPFTLQEVAQGAKQLLAYQVAAEKVNETVIRLGNISAGVGVPLGQLVAVYGQVKAKGKLQGDDMKQFMNAGIPIIEELAKVTGKADDEIQQLVTDGKIGFAEVQKVIENLTDKGGMFFNLMEEQSKTLSGQISNLQDAWDRMLNSIGQSNSGLISGLIGGATFAVENYQEILDIIIPLIAAYGTYRAALLVTVAAQKAALAFTMAKEYIAMAKALGMATANQMMFNKAVLANPYALAAAAVVGLSLAIYNFIKNTDALSEKSKVLSDVTSEVSTQLEHETSILEVYKRRIAQTNTGSKERVRLVKELNEKYPDLLRNVDAENASIETLSKTFNTYITDLEKTIRLKTLESKLADIVNEKQNLETQFREKAISANEMYEQSQKLDERRNVLIEELQYQKDLVDYGQKNADLLKEKRKLEEELASIPTLANELRAKPQTFDEFKAMQLQLAAAAEAAGKPFKASLDDIKKAYDDYVKSINKTNQDYETKVNRINEINGLLKNGGGENEKPQLRTVDVIDAEIKKLKDEQQALSDTAKKWDEYQGKIDKLNKEREGITGTKKDSKKTGKVGIWDEKEALDKDLQDFATYQDKRLSIIDKYSKSRQRLQEQGYDEQAAEASAQMQKELDELDAAQFKKLESYRWVYDNLEKMGRKALKDYIARLKKEIDAFEGNEEVKLELTKKLADADEKLAEYTPDELREGAELLQEMAGLAGQFDENLGKALDTAANLATELAGAMAGFSSGNVIQGVTGVVSMVSTVAGLFKKNQKPQSQVIDEWISKMQKLLSLQEKSLSLFTDKQQVAELDKLLSTVNTQMDALIAKAQKQLDKMINSLYIADIDYAAVLGVSNNVASWTNDDWLRAINNATGDHKKQLQSLYDEWIELQNAQQDYINQQNELLTGSTYDSIVSSIRDGFADGFDSVEDFADGFEELMKQAMLQAMQIQYLEPAIQDWYNSFAEANKDGLTKDEIAKLQDAYNSIITGAEGYASALEQATGMTIGNSEVNNQSLSGTISGASEETVSLMSGYINAVRINQIESMSIMRNQLDSLNRIGENTKHNVKLNDILSVMTEIKNSLSTRQQGF